MDGLTEPLADLEARIDSGLLPAELIDLITTLENGKRTLAALQARATAAYATRLRDTQNSRDSAAAISREIALARKCSPHTGNTWLGVADALTTEMPHTLQALRDGRICELTARDVVSQTTHVSAEHRAVVDAALTREFHRAGATRRQIAGSARALADQLDPTAAVERRRRAEGERHVSLRPGHDHMAFLTACLPLVQAVSCEAALRRAVAQHYSDFPDEERTPSQLTADILTERVTGAQYATDPVPVEVQLVMTEETLLRGGNASASFPGHGPIAAAHARELVADAADRDQAWIRRVYTAPGGERLVAMDSTRRLFPAGLARFLRLRDQRCNTPWCDAPVHHVDHVRPWSRGGATTADNGQGLCARCNYTKDLTGFRTLRDPTTGVTTFITRTGHRYDSEPPPVLGHVTLPERRKTGRRASDLAVAA